MEIDSIKNRLKEVYDEFTTDILLNTILEYQELYKEKYIKTDEVIELLINNIPNGIKVYEDTDSIFDATCSLTDKVFKINRSVLSNKEYFNYVFFHEFLHAISFRKYDDIYYMGFYTIEKGEDYEFKSKPFTEAFTEYITLKRNEMFNYEKENGSLSGYDVGATELKLLFNIISEEELIDAFFNHPYDLEDILKKYNMSMDEIFYSFYALENMDVDIKAIQNKRGMQEPGNLFKIIDGERYLFYNMLDSFGTVSNEEEFNNKWNTLLKERDLKYNFYKIDGIFRYGELIRDYESLGIDNLDIVYSKISKELYDKYKFLSSIFSQEQESILYELNKIYAKDYKEYFDLIVDDFTILPYTFLKDIKNNYQLSDVELYPRVYPYLKIENASIESVIFNKIVCEEDDIRFYIFNINGNNYVESNYDDTTVNKIDNITFEIKYDNKECLLNILDNTYKIEDNIYECKVIY